MGTPRSFSKWSTNWSITAVVRSKISSMCSFRSSKSKLNLWTIPCRKSIKRFNWRSRTGRCLPTFFRCRITVWKSISSNSLNAELMPEILWKLYLLDTKLSIDLSPSRMAKTGPAVRSQPATGITAVINQLFSCCFFRNACENAASSMIRLAI